MKCVDLNEDTIKLLGSHYSHNKQIENHENCKNDITRTL